MEHARKQVVVVGAGLSGYAAAAKLMEKGFTNVVVLEAEARIGGRIHSVDYLDGKIDLGAQWCHGQKGNVIYETAHKTFSFGTTRLDDVYQTFLLSNGSRPNQKSLRKLVTLAYKIMDDDKGDMKDYDGTFGQFVLEKFDKKMKSSEYRGIDPKLIAMFKEHLDKEVSGFYASNSWHDVSASLDYEYESAKGNQYLTWKKKGFVTFFDFLNKKALKNSNFLDVDSKVQLGKKVTSIKFDLKAESVAVETSDGQKYNADHLIFTGSLGVLKKYHKSLFTPALPQKKVKAIEAYAMGGIGKIFLEFEKPFWSLDLKSFVSFAFLWDDAQKEEARKTDREWLTGITGFFVVDQYPKLLEGFFGGPKLAEFEGIPNEKLVSDCVWFFEKFLGKPLSETPKLIHRTQWLTNENFLGAYSYNSVSAEKANVGPEELAESVKSGKGTPIILFAGEATDFNYPSYAHGAVSSGYRAAEELTSFYANNQ